MYSSFPKKLPNGKTFQTSQELAKWILDQYVNQGANIRQIATSVGISKQAVSMRLREFPEYHQKRALSKIKPLVPCAYCGKSYPPVSHKQKCCSKPCSGKHLQQRYHASPEWKKRKTLNRKAYDLYMKCTSYEKINKVIGVPEASPMTTYVRIKRFAEIMNLPFPRKQRSNQAKNKKTP